MLFETNANIIEGNWEQLKGEIKKQWGKLTDKDLTRMEGSYEQLTGKLQETYGYSEEEVKKKIKEFVSNLDLKSLKEKAEEAKNGLYEKVDGFRKSATDAFNNFQEKTSDIQENIINYVKENPMKSVGFAVIVGIIATKLISK